MARLGDAFVVPTRVPSRLWSRDASLPGQAECTREWRRSSLNCVRFEVYFL